MQDVTILVEQRGCTHSFGGDGTRTLLENLRAAGCKIAADCGGRGRCGRCAVTVTGPVSGRDGAVLPADSERLLACRWYPRGEVRVRLPDEEPMRVVLDGASVLPGGGQGLGAAVDIGTTTLAVFLYDLESGALLAERGARNAQRPYGADVISRIRFCAEPDGLLLLGGAVRAQISEALAGLCCDAGRGLGEITALAVAGNTVMEHLFCGLDPTPIGVSPFTPQSLFGDIQPASRFLPGLPDGAELYVCPAVAGYVGGDITAGLLSSGAYRSEETVLFLDIGTNGEMALGNRDGFVCCAAAAGPAFEGAEIACGMEAAPGAIDRVWFDGADVAFTTIGGAPVRGICGSGLVDAIAALLESGAILPSGRLCTDGSAFEAVRRRGRKSPDGERLYLTPDVFLSAGDIRSVQLAKAALRAGMETLLRLRGMQSSDIARVLVAGGFGAYLNLGSACRIGLLPPAAEKIARHIGNAAGAGAALALTAQGRRTLRALTERCSYHELSGSPVFRDAYLEAMPFEE
jgi:uncharacterized 2Fe-2S/4Fe-4S cluster protein (DUF4445 family)